MAEIQAPILPARLYRYRSLLRTPTATADEIHAIRKTYLYCPPFSAMNDPMEGIFRSDRFLRVTPEYRDALSKIEDEKSEIGIACFSETYKNMLMWAHYAGNCTGICLGYSSADLMKGLPKEAAITRMAYLDKPPTIRSLQPSDVPAAARRILSQKHYSWSYEREWRVLAPCGPVSYAPKQALRELYFGARISQSQRDLLVSAVSGLTVAIYEMEVSGYSPLWELVDTKEPTREARDPKAI